MRKFNKIKIKSGEIMKKLVSQSLKTTPYVINLISIINNITIILFYYNTILYKAVLFLKMCQRLKN